jgi:hypothetical protein
MLGGSDRSGCLLLLTPTLHSPAKPANTKTARVLTTTAGVQAMAFPGMPMQQEGLLSHRATGKLAGGSIK